MKLRPPTPTPPSIMKHLSPNERKTLLAAHGRRPEYPRRSKPAKAGNKAAKLATLIVACAGAMLAGTVPARAAETASPVSAPALFNQANADQRARRLGPA